GNLQILAGVVLNSSGHRLCTCLLCTSLAVLLHSADHTGRCYLVEGLAAACCHSFGLLELLQGIHGAVNDVDGVHRAHGFGQHVMDACAVQHGADRTTGDHTGTWGRRAQQDHTCGVLTLDQVRDGGTDPGD